MDSAGRTKLHHVRDVQDDIVEAWRGELDLDPPAELRVLRDEPVARYTSFRVGGPADYLVRPAGLAALREALAWAREEGLDATGKVGDPNVALGAIEDELRLSGADEVVISTHPPGQSNWLETGIVERLREELDIPVTHLIVDRDRAPAAPA